TTYPSYALNLAQLGALCISNLCATKPIEYQKYAHINWKFVFISCLCMIWDFDLNRKIKELKVQIKSD
ncbi:hypothetical protein BTH27_01665, partial [Acinetobacter baumannii]